VLARDDVNLFPGRQRKPLLDVGIFFGVHAVSRSPSTPEPVAFSLPAKLDTVVGSPL
jgi:hypothetical protein